MMTIHEMWVFQLFPRQHSLFYRLMSHLIHFMHCFFFVERLKYLLWRPFLFLTIIKKINKWCDIFLCMYLPIKLNEGWRNNALISNKFKVNGCRKSKDTRTFSMFNDEQIYIYPIKLIILLIVLRLKHSNMS